MSFFLHFKMVLFFLVSFILLIFSSQALFASKKLNVLTTTTTLKSIVKAVGKDLIKVNSITKGPQDPHYIEPKPSYMVQARKADLIVSVGLDLEIGWLQNIIRGARNPRIRKGQKGYLETGEWIKPIEIVRGKVDRSQGDIHPKGNPHFTLDPILVMDIIQEVAERLATLDPKNEIHYIKNKINFEKKIRKKILIWDQRIKKSKIRYVVTYHKTLNYFLKRFQLKALGFIEPKPGIPPTAKYILSLIKAMKKTNTSCVLLESFFKPNAIKKIKENVFVTVETVATEVGAIQMNPNYEDLIENLVVAIENCSKKREKKIESTQY